MKTTRTIEQDVKELTSGLVGKSRAFNIAKRLQTKGVYVSFNAGKKNSLSFASPTGSKATIFMQSVTAEGKAVTNGNFWKVI